SPHVALLHGGRIPRTLFDDDYRRGAGGISHRRGKNQSRSLAPPAGLRPRRPHADRKGRGPGALGDSLGETIGAPVALGIENRDWKNWTKKMSIFPEDRDDKIAVTKPR